MFTIKEFVQGILERLQSEFDPEVLGAGFAGLLSNIVVCLLTFLAFYVLWRLTNPVVKALLGKTSADETLQTFLNTAYKYAVLTLGLVQALGAIGINTSAIFASLGLAGLTIGFAARDALSNIISGILIFWDRPFVIGDLVEIDDDYGRVEKITLRSTRVVTIDGKMLAVPNTTVINSTVASYTNFPHLRIDIDITVGVNEDIDRVRELLLSLVAGDDSFGTNPAPRVVVKALNDYNLELELQVWLLNERDHIKQRFALREKAYRTLLDAGVDMPFETIQVEPLTLNGRQVA